MIKQKLEESFIRALLKRASSKFFSQHNESCLYYQNNIRAKLTEVYKNFFDNPEESEDIPNKLVTLAGLLNPKRATKGFIRQEESVGISEWVPKAQGTFWISPSQFMSLENANEYIWENPITYVRQYVRSSPLELTDALAHFNERVLVLNFSIRWRAKVSIDGRFRKMEYLSDEVSKRSFRPITDDDRSAWNLG